MKHTIYPHRLNKYFAIPMGLFCIVCCFFCGQLLDSGNHSLAIGYLLFAGICLIFGKYLLDTAQYHVELTEENLTISQGNALVTLSAQDIRFVCHTTSRKGHRCLILSTESLNATQAKNLAQKSALTSKVFVDNTVIIFLHQQKDPDALDTFLADHYAITDFG